MGPSFCNSSLYANENKYQQAKEKYKEISKYIKKNKYTLSKKKKAKRQAENEYIRLSRQLRHTELQIRYSKAQLAKLQNKINTSKTNLVLLNQDFNNKKYQLAKRIVEIYKNEHIQLLNFIFFPQNYHSIVDSIYYFGKLIEADVFLIKQIRYQYQIVKAEKNQLKKNKNKLLAVKHSIKEKETTLSRQKKRKQKYIISLKSEIARINRENQELLRDSRRISQIINKLAKSVVYYGKGFFIKPVKGWLSSPFGRRKHPILKKYIPHTGIDLAAAKGTIIKAADAGIVIVAGRKPEYAGYGKVTIIDHGRRKKDGKRISTVYAHQSRIFVRPGQRIEQGQDIGWVGSTGYSTGPHLHFELRENGIPVDPLKYIRL
jgi:murein DD-endopeptidase MepM/ murein hydrolase activator NlpD